MMIFVHENNNGTEIMINPDHIVMVDYLTDADGKHFSRIYMANGHRAFIDVKETMGDIYDMIYHKETFYNEQVLKTLRSTNIVLDKICKEVKKK